MSLFLYIGLTLLSWYPVLVPLMIVGGIAAFLVALLTPERARVATPAPVRSREALVLERDGDAVLDLRDARLAHPAGLVPGPRRGHRVPSNA